MFYTWVQYIFLLARFGILTFSEWRSLAIQNCKPIWAMYSFKPFCLSSTHVLLVYRRETMEKGPYAHITSGRVTRVTERGRKRETNRHKDRGYKDRRHAPCIGGFAGTHENTWQMHNMAHTWPKSMTSINPWKTTSPASCNMYMQLH